ncbi:MAG: serine hydroxymethyltransferase [bacterium]|nr:serine hydroxymethyltransferase [bacterium]
MVLENDSELRTLLQMELERQKNTLTLIPSENITSPAVLEALGFVGTNKYSEGYPGKRYYGGNDVIDKIETLAKERAMKLFGAQHINIQAYSGSPANLAAYFALLEPGDTIMGMSLPFGGHLTHGWKVNFSAKYYTAIQYETNKDGFLDYESIALLAKEHRPKLIVCGATAYPREIDFKKFREIADSVGAYLLADISHIAGLVAGGVHSSPVPYADVITTTLHKTLRGPRGALIMCKKEHAEKIDKAVFPGLQGGPHNNVTAAAAVALYEALSPDFSVYAKQVIKNAQKLSERLVSAGFQLITGGTDNHLLLIDLSNKNMPGKEAERILNSIGIIVNKNMVPFDSRSPFDPSGIRLGTPAVTTRGLLETDMESIAQIISDVLSTSSDEGVCTSARKSVQQLCTRYPIYQNISYGK